MPTVRKGRFFRTVMFAGLLTAVAVGAEARSGADDVCVLSNALGRVEVSLTGARILSWRTAAGEELLFMPAQATSVGSEWSHGGIPLCWPWFGRRDGVIHGFVRTKRFAVVRRTADGVLLRYALAAGEEPSFPHEAEVEVEVLLKDRLSLVLRTRNTGGTPFSFTCGVHPYLAVTDYGRLTFGGVEAEPFACVDGMDKAFARRPDGVVSVVDKVSGLSLVQSVTGNSHVIVWTPGTVEPANRNLRPADMTKFIGFGPAFSKAAGAIDLKSGESHALSVLFSLTRRK